MDKRRAIFYVLAGGWLPFAINFIYRTSHISIDGVRYFTIFDDGMIAMRYAKNLIAHHGLVWNVGERIEGFTNPLWTLLMAGVIWLFGTHYAPLIMQILGAITCLAIFAVYYRTSEKNRGCLLSLSTGLLILTLSYPASYWALGGMEAGAVCLAFAIAAGVQYSYENGTSANPLLILSCLIAIAYAFRPDGWLPIAPFFLASLFDSLRERKYSRALAAFTIVGVVMSSVMVARLLYYGAWVPNTYVLKVEGYDLWLRLSNGRAFVGQFYDQNFSLLALIGLAALSKRRIAYLGILAGCITLGYQVYVGGDPWLYWRQLLPLYVLSAFAVLIILSHVDKLSPARSDVHGANPGTLALLAILIALPVIAFRIQYYLGTPYLEQLLPLYAAAAFASLVGLNHAGKLSLPAKDALLLSDVIRVIVVVIACGSIVTGNMKFVPELTGKPYSFAEQAKLIDKAVLSNKLLGSGKTHHSTWAGTYPYYVEGKMIDPLGKSDLAIARYPVDEGVAWNGMRGVPGHAKYDFRDTILNRNPDVIVDHLAWGRQDLTQELRDRYVLITSNGVSLCVRKDTAAGLEEFQAASCPRDLLYPLIERPEP